MRVALIGPPQSGKSTLFAAVAEAGGSHVDISRPDQPHLAVVKVPDERVHWLARLYNPKKVTLAELELLDLPGFDLSDEQGRSRAKAHWAAMRQSDMLAMVVRSFESQTVFAYRKRIDPASDVDELLSEMLFADLDQVTNRIQKLNASLKKPTPKRDEYARELELMQRLNATLETSKPISQAIRSDSEAKMVRSFAFLSQKPALMVDNCSEDALGKPPTAPPGGMEHMRLSAKIEEELARLEPSERAEFLADMGLDASAGQRLVRACYKAMNLASFLTTGEDECRAWTIQAGADAVTAAGAIHTDIARGFIRAETVSFADLQTAGDMKAAKAAGKVRLEGKNYLVKDGDVINFRFNV